MFLDAFSGILGGLGGLSSLLGGLGLGQSNIPYEQLNPYFNSTMNDFQRRYDQSDARLSQLLGRSEQTTNRLQGVQGNLANLMQELGGINAPTVNEGFNLYQSRMSPLMEQARQVASMFTQPYRQAAGDVADRRADDAARGVMGQFAGQGFSGAAQAAAAAAASDVLSDYESNVANMYGQIGSNFAGNALGQERGLSESGVQNRYANIINNLLQRAGLEQARGASIGQQAGLLGNLAGTEGQRASSLRNNIGALSSPNYQQPMTSNPLGALGQGLSGFGDMFGNPDFQNLFQSTTAPVTTPYYNIPQPSQALNPIQRKEYYGIPF
jgi:uncharacterized phage infection (PIP) family protein YhgE